MEVTRKRTERKQNDKTELRPSIDRSPSNETSGKYSSGNTKLCHPDICSKNRNRKDKRKLRFKYPYTIDNNSCQLTDYKSTNIRRLPTPVTSELFDNKIHISSIQLPQQRSDVRKHNSIDTDRFLKNKKTYHDSKENVALDISIHRKLLNKKMSDFEIVNSCDAKSINISDFSTNVSRHSQCHLEKLLKKVKKKDLNSFNLKEINDIGLCLKEYFSKRNKDHHNHHHHHHHHYNHQQKFNSTSNLIKYEDLDIKNGKTKHVDMETDAHNENYSNQKLFCRNISNGLKQVAAKVFQKAGITSQGESNLNFKYGGSYKVSSLLDGQPLKSVTETNANKYKKLYYPQVNKNMSGLFDDEDTKSPKKDKTPTRISEIQHKSLLEEGDARSSSEKGTNMDDISSIQTSNNTSVGNSDGVIYVDPQVIPLCHSPLVLTLEPQSSSFDGEYFPIREDDISSVSISQTPKKGDQSTISKPSDEQNISPHQNISKEVTTKKDGSATGPFIAKSFVPRPKETMPRKLVFASPDPKLKVISKSFVPRPIETMPRRYTQFKASEPKISPNTPTSTPQKTQPRPEKREVEVQATDKREAFLESTPKQAHYKSTWAFTPITPDLKQIREVNQPSLPPIKSDPRQGSAPKMLKSSTSELELVTSARKSSRDATNLLTKSHDKTKSGRSKLRATKDSLPVFNLFKEVTAKDSENYTPKKQITPRKSQDSKLVQTDDNRYYSTDWFEANERSKTIRFACSIQGSDSPEDFETNKQKLFLKCKRYHQDGGMDSKQTGKISVGDLFHCVVEDDRMREVSKEAAEIARRHFKPGKENTNYKDKSSRTPKLKHLPSSDQRQNIDQDNRSVIDTGNSPVKQTDLAIFKRVQGPTTPKSNASIMKKGTSPNVLIKRSASQTPEGQTYQIEQMAYYSGTPRSRRTYESLSVRGSQSNFKALTLTPPSLKPPNLKSSSVRTPQQSTNTPHLRSTKTQYPPPRSLSTAPQSEQPHLPPQLLSRTTSSSKTSHPEPSTASTSSRLTATSTPSSALQPNPILAKGTQTSTYTLPTHSTLSHTPKVKFFNPSTNSFIDKPLIPVRSNEQSILNVPRIEISKNGPQINSNIDKRSNNNHKHLTDSKDEGNNVKEDHYQHCCSCCCCCRCCKSCCHPCCCHGNWCHGGHSTSCMLDCC